MGVICRETARRPNTVGSFRMRRVEAAAAAAAISLGHATCGRPAQLWMGWRVGVDPGVPRCTHSHSGGDNSYSKDSPYSTAERRVPELIPVLGSQPGGDVSHKPGGRLPLLSAMPAVTRATLKRAATNFAAWCVNRGTMGVNSLPTTIT